MLNTLACIAFLNSIASVNEVCVCLVAVSLSVLTLFPPCLLAAALRQREPFIPSVVPHLPVKYAPRAADNTAHGWINPRGSFFP